MRFAGYLPPRDIQTKVLKALSKAHTLRAELDAIESSLKSRPAIVDKQLEVLRKVNHEDTFEIWLETLPFPLASILWRWRVSRGQKRDENEVLLHFSKHSQSFGQRFT